MLSSLNIVVTSIKSLNSWNQGGITTELEMNRILQVGLFVLCYIWYDLKPSAIHSNTTSQTWSSFVNKLDSIESLLTVRSQNIWHMSELIRTLLNANHFHCTFFPCIKQIKKVAIYFAIAFIIICFECNFCYACA